MTAEMVIFLAIVILLFVAIAASGGVRKDDPRL